MSFFLIMEHIVDTKNMCIKDSLGGSNKTISRAAATQEIISLLFADSQPHQSHLKWPRS